MFDRFLRRGAEARYRRINEGGGISKDGPAPSEEPLSAESVFRVLRALSELGWVRLAAVEKAGSADPDSIKNAERIYRNAYATAGRRGLFDQLGRELLAVRQEATEVAKAAAGEEALAAHRRFEAVFNGRGVLVDPADAPAVSRYLGFKDAATNAVSAAALRPHISRRDFAYLWRGYATVLDFTTKGNVTLPTDATVPLGEPVVPAERLEDGRVLFGPNAAEVLRVVDLLYRAEPNAWLSLVGAHMAAYGPDASNTARAARVSLLVDQGARSGVSSGAITAKDLSEAKRIATAAAARVIPVVIAEARSKSPIQPEDLDLAVANYLQTAAVSLVVFVVVRPFLEAEEFEELWAPYAAVAPLSPSPDRRPARDMDAERQAWWIAHVAQPAVANRSEIQPGDNDRLSDEVRTLWPKVVDAFVKRPPQRPFIQAARFGGVEGNVVVLAFPSEMRYLCEMGERRAESLAGTMSQVLERSVAVECRVVEPAAPRTTLAPSTDGSASPTTWTAPERELAALGYPQVARFVHSLGRLAPDEMLFLEGRVAGYSMNPDAFAITDVIRDRHEHARLWPLTTSAVKQQPALTSASQHLQAVTVVAGLALGAKCDLEAETWERVWRPFGETIPYLSVWADDASEPAEFQSVPAVDALGRARREFAALLSRIGE